MQRYTSTGSRWLLAVAAMAMALAACNTDRLLQADPKDRVDAGLFDKPAQAALMVNSAVADFECAFASAALVEGIISDEFTDAQLGAAAWPYDRRDANTQPGGSYGVNGCNDSQTPGIYLPLSTARFDAEAAEKKLSAWTDAQVVNRTALLSKAALYAGFSYAMMGMSMCEAAFDLSPQMSQTAIFARAEQHFTTAITEGQKAVTAAASAADKAALTAVVNAAYLGRARVRLFQGNAAAAATDAANVPAGFAYMATYDGGNSRRYNRFFASVTHFTFYSVDASARALTTEGVADPRAAVVRVATKGADNTTPIYAPVKYSDYSSPIRLASYDEAQLIIAEAQGGSQAVTVVNALRDAVGLPHYTGATDAASIKTLIANERQRALFAEGFRNYDIQRLNLPLNPAAGTNYPGKGGQYGTTTCLPLPDIERFNNPNIHG